MEKLTRCFLSAVLLLNSVSAKDEFFGEGGTLALRPRSTGKIASIQWKHKSNLVAEWVEGIVELQYYGSFQNRTTMNTNTGGLEITNMSRADSGVYSVEVNNKVQAETYTARLIGKVGKPIVILKPLKCTAESENCNLHCEGNITEAGPVTYRWKMDGGSWMEGEKVWSITNDETTQGVEDFFCRMKNPIGEEESGRRSNPFYRKNDPDSSRGGLAAGLTLFLLVLAAGCGLAFWKREAIRERIPQLRNSNGNNVQGLSPAGNSTTTEGEGKPLNQPAAADIV